MSVTTSEEYAYFAITDPRQVWIIRETDESQLRWLELLTSTIPNSVMSRSPISAAGGVNLGLFQYWQFREFLRSAGYREAVSRADAIYHK